MARKDNNPLFKDDINSSCTESFGADIDIVVDRRVNFVLQHTKNNTDNLRIQQRINEIEEKLDSTSGLDQDSLINIINDIDNAYWDLIFQHVEDAYKQGFKDAMQLMFATK